MNEHLLPNTSILYGVKPGNSGTHVHLISACDPCLDSDHIESQAESPKLNQRLPGAV